MRQSISAGVRSDIAWAKTSENSASVGSPETAKAEGVGELYKIGRTVEGGRG